MIDSATRNTTPLAACRDGRAVLDAYGWTDLKPTCEFLLDYEDEEDQELSRSQKVL